MIFIITCKIKNSETVHQVSAHSFGEAVDKAVALTKEQTGKTPVRVIAEIED